MRVENGDHAQAQIPGAMFGGELLFGVELESVRLLAIVGVAARDSDDGGPIAAVVSPKKTSATFLGRGVFEVGPDDAPRFRGNADHMPPLSSQKPSDKYFEA